VGETESSEATEIPIHQRQLGYFELSVPRIRLYVRCLFAGKESRIYELRSYYRQPGSWTRAVKLLINGLPSPLKRRQPADLSIKALFASLAGVKQYPDGKVNICAVRMLAGKDIAESSRED